MKLRAAITLVLAAAAINAAPAAAQNMTGTWQISSEGGRGPVTQTLVLTQTGNTLTGTITFGGGRGRGGGGGGGGIPPVEISNGTVDGATFRFTVSVDFGGRGAVEQVFTGHYESDFMEGQIEGGRGGARPFMGSRSD